MNFDYPSPKADKRFQSYWDRYIDNITTRDNFKQEHLDQLTVLCQMYVDIETLEEQIQEDGFTYESIGRNGRQIKPHPLLSQLNVTRNQIAMYNRMLGLVLMKDNKLNESTENEDWK